MKKEKDFKTGDFAIYPSHGIGKILKSEKIEIANHKTKILTMYFEKEKLTIKVPVSQIEKIGMRHLTTKAQMDEVFDILRSGVKKLKGMWSRRAQEYESKINSGDVILLAEVLRDLTRDIEDGDRSYSERIIYETATYRLASEYAAIYGVPFEEAKDKIITTAKNKIGDVVKINENLQRDNFDDEFDLDDEEEDEEEDDDEDSFDLDDDDDRAQSA
ncbi:MAG: CarD family transcriptional regulator [Proteobacteria bacterium]|nr:CarD family transcriptional regulator [Pseudomonadota bacterium]